MDGFAKDRLDILIGVGVLLLATLVAIFTEEFGFAIFTVHVGGLGQK